MDNLYKNIVYSLYNYTECLKSDEEFYREFHNLVSLVPDIEKIYWLKELHKTFKLITNTDEQEQEEDISILQTEFRFDIMKTLQELKTSGQYTDVILSDYKKYLVK